MAVFDKIRDNYGYDFSQQIDQAFEYIQWPKEIQLYCYSCFGEVVKVRDVLTDVGVLTDIGDMISYDFNIRMPNYMKPAKPLGKLAQKTVHGMNYLTRGLEFINRALTKLGMYFGNCLLA